MSFQNMNIDRFSDGFESSDDEKNTFDILKHIHEQANKRKSCDIVVHTPVKCLKDHDSSSFIETAVDITVDDDLSKSAKDSTNSDLICSSDENIDYDSGIDNETEINDQDDDGTIGGFTRLTTVDEDKSDVVPNFLPPWLQNPVIIENDLENESIPIESLKCVDESLCQKLRLNGINNFFPVQKHIIPVLLSNSLSGNLASVWGMTPCDICCSAPTGSGKTLAFVIPIVQALQNRVVCRIRALCVLPVRELAIQVYKVFQTYTEGTKLQVGLLVGQNSYAVEKQAISRQSPYGVESRVDIIVATPGRLLDHINQGDNFSLSHLRYLIIDEADRMMEEIKQDWLNQIEAAAYKSENRNSHNHINVESLSQKKIPLQKLLFSATLSQNPEKLQSLNLFQPKLFTSVINSEKNCDDAIVGEDLDISSDKSLGGEFIGKYTTPSSLKESLVFCTSQSKPLILLYLLHHLNYRRILCFTNSSDTAHRLRHHINLSGVVQVEEFSASLTNSKRKRILKQFKSGKVDILICTDAMARGIDIDDVQYVISYDAPHFLKTYIHRIGRTARAGRTGEAFTFLERKEIFHFKNMLKNAGKSNLNELKISSAELENVTELHEKCLENLEDVLKSEQDRIKLSKK